MPNQYGDDEVAEILDLETRQRQDAAAREALGEKPQEPSPAPAPPPAKRQRARRPPEPR
ncbi:hypothetical protein D3C72_807950 [compost metagenome]